MKRTLTTVAIAASLTASASAQSFNVEWGSLDSSPPDTYRGVGLPGVWNTFDAMPNFVRFPLVDLNGDPIPADIMNIGFDVVEVFDNPLTSGGDAALLDDCFTSFNDPIDGCIFMRFLEPGEYLVVLYGMTPDDDTNMSQMRIDQNTLPPVFVGGAWPGFHQSGITYMIQEATVGSDGRLDFHSGDRAPTSAPFSTACRSSNARTCASATATPRARSTSPISSPCSSSSGTTHSRATRTGAGRSTSATS